MICEEGLAVLFFDLSEGPTVPVGEDDAIIWVVGVRPADGVDELGIGEVVIPVELDAELAGLSVG